MKKNIIISLILWLSIANSIQGSQLADYATKHPLITAAGIVSLSSLAYLGYRLYKKQNPGKIAHHGMYLEGETRISDAQHAEERIGQRIGDSVANCKKK